MNHNGMAWSALRIVGAFIGAVFIIIFLSSAAIGLQTLFFKQDPSGLLQIAGGALYLIVPYLMLRYGR